MKNDKKDIKDIIDGQLNLTLYLSERETRDGFEHYLDKYIRLYPAKDIEEIIINQTELTLDELQELSRFSREEIKSKLFAKFSITDLRDYPGLPKGPYYWVDDEVYNKILSS